MFEFRSEFWLVYGCLMELLDKTTDSKDDDFRGGSGSGRRMGTGKTRGRPGRAQEQIKTIKRQIWIVEIEILS